LGGDVPVVAKPGDVAALFETPKDVVAEKPKRQVIRVRRGDSLWRIARRHLGNGKKWDKFYRLNKHKIDNPDLIYPGQTLILPG
jgi:nucleoid-associated protein YgaU